MKVVLFSRRFACVDCGALFLHKLRDHERRRHGISSGQIEGEESEVECEIDQDCEM